MEQQQVDAIQLSADADDEIAYEPRRLYDDQIALTLWLILKQTSSWLGAMSLRFKESVVDTERYDPPFDDRLA